VANPTFDFANWALQAAPYLAPPLAPVALAAQAMGAGAKPPVVKPSAPEAVQIGSERDFGPNIGTKVYTGPRYGYQTIDTARTMKPQEAAPDATEQAEFRRLQQVLESRFGGAKKPAEKPPSTVETRGPSTPTSAGLPSQPPASQSTDPQTDYYNKLLERLLDPELRAKLAAQDTEQAIKRALLTSALSMRQTRENSRRQIELQNIDAWKELERARIEANARQQIALGSTIAASMLPSQGVMGALGGVYQAALSPFNTFSLK
jgi:hypothetical protein